MDSIANLENIVYASVKDDLLRAAEKVNDLMGAEVLGVFVCEGIRGELHVTGLGSAWMWTSTHLFEFPDFSSLSIYDGLPIREIVKWIKILIDDGDVLLVEFNSLSGSLARLQAESSPNRKVLLESIRQLLSLTL